MKLHTPCLDRATPALHMLALLTALAPAACGHNWDAYDPRLGGSSGSVSTSSSGGASTSGGAGGATSSTGGTTSSGGAGGATTSTGASSTSTGATAGSGGTGGTGGSTTSTGTAGTGGGGVCMPGSKLACYEGPPGTQNTGNCKDGSKTCGPDGSGYGPCTGQVKPAVEICATPAADEDCNSVANDHCALWAKLFGDDADQRANAVTVDLQGNVIVVGRATETINFGGQDLNAGGSFSAFVAKFASDGTHMWSKLYGDASDQEALAVAVDLNNNILVTGTFAGSIAFAQTGESMLTSTGGLDTFVVKLDANGNYIWTRGISGAGDQYGRGIAADGQSNVYVTGSFAGSTLFAGSMATAVDGLDAYLLKLGSNGTLGWLKTFGDGGDDEGTSLSRNEGSVVMGGYFHKSITLGLNATFNGGGGADAFVARFEAGGNLVYGKAAPAPGDQRVTSVRADPGSNSVFVFGDFTQAWDPGVGVALPSSGGKDLFVLKLGPLGAATWAKGFGNGSDQTAGAAAVDASGDVIIAAHLVGAMDLGGGFHKAPGAAPSGDVLVAKLAGKDGSYVWSRSFGDALDQEPRGLAADMQKNLFVVGGAQGTVDFGTGMLKSTGGYDAFVAKLAP